MPAYYKNRAGVIQTLDVDEDVLLVVDLSAFCSLDEQANASCRFGSEGSSHFSAFGRCVLRTLCLSSTSLAVLMDCRF